ncbi:helix-turn-helix transcriptional regulator [Azospirillum canadense]|uniref:helix-turn-helix transcriptional regulator n=1 Tax=Azospirillum canadense TaxID=403962 RepID=UPI002225C9E3|nr:helix-turn-helix transcriptional regulator [Azospirillum canadense]MCW2235698.1 excisionase family DNA binding protein [Azospirillum canadense]
MVELLNTREVADYLRLKQRKIYDLVQRGDIPCTRVGGKWLFPRDQIDRWLSARESVHRDAAAPLRTAAPPVIAGSHDPLLEWCVDESRCGLALMGGGSLTGVERLAEGAAVACGLHVRDAVSGVYNIPLVERRLGDRDVVVLEWARREQGLVVAAGNPMGIQGIADLARSGARLVRRPPETGAQTLFDQLVAEAGLRWPDLAALERPVRVETDVGLAVLNGQADAGLAIRSVAHQLRLDFVPLHWERYDLVMRRRDVFEPPLQRLLAFARSPAAARRAEELQGYDLSGFGTVHFNGP